MFTSTSINRNTRGLTVAGLVALIAFVGLILASFFLIKIRTVEGNEIGVLETWSDGVSETPLTPKTYVFFPGFNKSVYTYPTSGRVFVMNDRNDKAEPFAEGRRADSLEINSLDNQKVRFHIIVTWRIDPAHVVALHKSYRDNIEERLIRPEVVRAVGTRATVQQAIDLYSGAKLNTLRQEVEAELKARDGKMSISGIVVDSFIIEKPDFPNIAYVTAIEARQLAIITESQAREQKKANEAIADAARAAALKQQYEEVVKAETAKQRGILEQEAISRKATIEIEANSLNAITAQKAESAKITLAAMAERDRNVLIAQGEKEAALSRAQAITALGEAESSALKLKLGAYAATGSEAYVRIEVAKSLAQAFSGVKGFLPANVNYTTVGKDFDNAVNVLVGAPAAK